MKIFLSEQIRELDERTIKSEPVSSTDLMERAAGQVFRWLAGRFSRSGRILIFAGPGNNGGDGLALARMLSVNGYKPEVYSVPATRKFTPDWLINSQRLESETTIRLNELSDAEEFPAAKKGDIIIDAIFGSGLTRPPKGLAAEVIRKINSSGARVISIDIPSGLFGEDNSSNSYEDIVHATHTLSFQFPKLAFMFPENDRILGEWTVLPIDLDKNAIEETYTRYQYIEKDDIRPLLLKRHKFDHKGIYGHGLLIAGSSGKMGSAVLGARAALRTGIGLLTCHIPSGGRIVLQVAVPEAMSVSDENEDHITGIQSIDSFDAAGIGPGLGTLESTAEALYSMIKSCRKPLVLDADALNILSLNSKWLDILPAGSVLTPHPKEFERIAGRTEGSWQQLERQVSFSAGHNCIVVLKGAHTSISTPGGKVFFNSTGNPGMATAGSGDVLTGIILSLLAQGYSPENAALTGVYLHGLAGDIAAAEFCRESILASDIINNIGYAFNMIRE